VKVRDPGHLGDAAQRDIEVDPKGCGFGGGAMSRKYAVIFEQAETNWAAYVPDLPGCVTTGRTLEETERNIREAISGHIETLQEFGQLVPEPTSVAKEVEVTPAA
jgi:predicted RNase H-like HicB family nuclease